MKKQTKDILPVLLGGDLNAYSMATSLKRGKGLSSIVLARERLAICDGPDYIDLYTYGDLDDQNVMVPVLLDIASKYKDRRLMLIPCSDWYMEAVQYSRDALSPYYWFNIPHFALWRAASDKVSFTQLMDRYGIPHPVGVCFDSSLKDFDSAVGGLRTPYVVKASDSCDFLRHKFPGQRKVYFADTVGECRQIVETIYKSGYGSRILVQECIPGAGGAMPHAAVLTTYSDSSGKVICGVRGEVLLEERGYTSRGNYSAIVASPLTSLDISLIAMLEGVGYTGIANFDLLKTPSGEVCLELNPRQGRSFDYTRAAGINLANFLVDDMCERELVPRFIYPDGFWREAGRRTVITHAERKELLERAMELERHGRGISAYDYRRGEGWMHKMYVACHGVLEHSRFLRYRKEAGGYAHS